MRLIHRYLVRELLAAAAFTLVVLTAVIALLVFSIVALRTSTAGLGAASLTEMVALVTATRLDVIVPLTALIASLWTYARVREDGELTAMRSAGIRRRHLLLPAVAVGASLTVAMAWLQDEVIPYAHYRQRAIAKRHLADGIESLLRGGNAIRDERFQCTWGHVGKDEEGFTVIHDVVVADTPRSGGPPVITRARVAVPRIDPARSELTLSLRELVHSDVMASETLEITLDLERLSADGRPTERLANRAYEELITLARRHAGEEVAARAAAELHRRAATAVSTTALALLGALLGCALRLAGPASVFTAGFLVVLALHYGPLMLTAGLAHDGALPAPSLWSGDALILALAAVLYVRAPR